MKTKYIIWKVLGVFFIIIMVLQSCDKTDDCTRTDRIGGGLLPEQDIEVPCDFPEPLPLGVLEYEQVTD